MKKILIISVFVLITIIPAFSQVQILPQEEDRTGNLYMYWGWNRGWYSKSDITLKGDNYHFTMYDVKAKDRQSPFGWDPYFKISRITIPQYNFRLGYFFKNNYTISFGVDHMKYVMIGKQTVKMVGKIDSSGTIYDGNYNDDGFIIQEDFLQFEHTDGLNYLNIEIRRFDEIWNLNKVKINLTEGFGVGALMPKTNAKFMTNKRHDEFHLAGFGMGAVVGLNITFYKHLFIQTEFKAGWIDMPDIRVSHSASDKACQNFFYTQWNVVFGVKANIKSKKVEIPSN